MILSKTSKPRFKTSKAFPLNRCGSSTLESSWKMVDPCPTTISTRRRRFIWYYGCEVADAVGVHVDAVKE